MRVVSAFIVLLAVIILFLLPITQAIYDFQTDQRQDTFNLVSTAAGVTTADVTILQALYDNDTATFEFSSNTSADVPIYSSYNSTNRSLTVAGLAGNTTRTLYVTYDVDALSGQVAIDAIMDRTPYFWYLALLCFIPAALLAIFTNRA